MKLEGAIERLVELTGARHPAVSWHADSASANVSFWVSWGEAVARSIVRSARLYLRQVGPDDADAFFALDRDPEVMRHIGDGSVTTDPAVTRAGLARVMAAYGRRPGLGLWACCRLLDEECVGWFALKPCTLTFPASSDAQEPGVAAEHVELGYRLRRDAWGHGFSTEMAIELLSYGFTSRGLDDIVAVCKPANVASSRVMLRAGLTHRGQGVYNTIPVDVYGAGRADWVRPDPAAPPAVPPR